MTRLQEVIEELREQGLIEMPEEVEEFVPDETPGGDDRLDRMEQQMQEFLNWQQQQADDAEEAAQIQELDKVIAQLHNEHGDFDDDWVLVQIAREVDPEQAVKNWNALIESKVSSHRTPKPSIPKVLRGSGTTPGGPAAEHKPRTAQDRVAYMTQMLQESANQ